MNLHGDDVALLCHPDLAVDAEMLMAVFGFHKVKVTPDRYCPRDKWYFIDLNMLRLPSMTFDWKVTLAP